MIVLKKVPLSISSPSFLFNAMYFEAFLFAILYDFNPADESVPNRALLHTVCGIFKSLIFETYAQDGYILLGYLTVHWAVELFKRHLLQRREV